MRYALNKTQLGAEVLAQNSVQSRGRSRSQSRFLTTRPKVDFKRPTFFDFLTLFPSNATTFTMEIN